MLGKTAARASANPLSAGACSHLPSSACLVMGSALCYPPDMGAALHVQIPNLAGSAWRNAAPLECAQRAAQARVRARS